MVLIPGGHYNHPKGHSNIEPIKTLEEHFKYIRLTTTANSWFRGESHEHDSFIPKLYRNMDPDDIDIQLETERKYFYDLGVDQGLLFRMSKIMISGLGISSCNTTVALLGCLIGQQMLQSDFTWR